MRGHRTSVTITVFAILAVFVSIPDPVRAVVARLDVADDELVKLGAEFPATGKVDPDGGCTLIAPTWVITAAHVASGMRGKQARVVFGDQEYAIKRIVVHKGSKSQPVPSKRIDLALVELAKPVTHVRPVPLFRGDDETGEVAYIAGFGDLRDGKGGLRLSDGTCRAVSNRISKVTAERLHVEFEKPPNGTNLEGVGAPGDSGGPMYLKRDGKTYLIGVSHASMGGKPQDYGVTDIYMRVSQFTKWIDKVTGTSSEKK